MQPSDEIQSNSRALCPYLSIDRFVWKAIISEFITRRAAYPRVLQPRAPHLSWPDTFFCQRDKRHDYGTTDTVCVPGGLAQSCRFFAAAFAPTVADMGQWYCVIHIYERLRGVNLTKKPFRASISPKDG